MILPGNFPRQQVGDLSDILTLNMDTNLLDQQDLWSRLLFPITRDHGHPYGHRDHREAVDLALKLLVDKNLVALSPHETLDVEYVSQVMNAAVEDGEDEPVIQYGSDYFVGLGRRYRDVPIVGSRLILRIGSNGHLFGVQKTWRPIVGEGEWVTTNPTPQGDQLPGLLLKDPGQANQNIIVRRTVSGYIEGPVKNEQLLMAPGCIINYTTSPGAEMASQRVIPLAPVNFPLSGTRKSFAPARVNKQDLIPKKDRDDRKKEDELN
jgi:hypothetical protein